MKTKLSHAALLGAAAAALLGASNPAWAILDAFVSGTINWTDQSGALHAARNVRVEVWETYTFSADAMLASFSVDRTGQYNGIDLGTPALTRTGSYLKVFTDNGAAIVTSDYATPYVFQTPNGGALNTGDNFLSLNIPIDTSDNFSVLDAMLTGYQFATDARGAAPGQAAVKFASTEGTFYQSTTNKIDVVKADGFDWDPTIHEYGHFITINDNIGISLPGDHSAGETSIPTLGKVNGSVMGFKEGVATWYAIAAQNHKQAVNNVPVNAARVGNLDYEDTDDANIRYSVEYPSGNKSKYTTTQGEGDELATIRILWDLGDDSGTGESFDRIARGQTQLYSDLKAAAAASPDGKLKTLSQTWKYFYDLKGVANTATSDKWRVDLGGIWQANGVSPAPLSPAGNSYNVFDAAPTFGWVDQNNQADDTFNIVIWNADYSARIVETADIISVDGTTFYTLTAADWLAVQTAFMASGAESQDYNWIVMGGDLYNNAGTAYAGDAITAKYWSDALTFSIVPEPGSAALAGLPLAVLARRRR